MPLDKYFNQQRPNVKSFLLETPRKEGDGIFAEEDFQWIGTKLKSESQTVAEGSEVARAKIISPEHFGKFSYGVDGLEELRAFLEQEIKDNKSSAYFSFLSSLKILNPNKFKDVEINDGMAHDLLEEINNNASTSLWNNFAYEAANLITVAPEKRRDIRVDDSVINGINNILSWYWERIGNFDYLYKYANLVSDFRVAFPEKYPLLEKNDLIREKLKEKLDSFRNTKDLHNFLEMAVALKIISAEKIEITSNGIEITMPTDESKHKKEESSIPQMRKF